MTCLLVLHVGCRDAIMVQMSLPYHSTDFNTQSRPCYGVPLTSSAYSQINSTQLRTHSTFFNLKIHRISRAFNCHPRYHPVTVNKHTAVQGKGGAVRIVVSHTRPSDAVSDGVYPFLHAHVHCPLLHPRYVPLIFYLRVPCSGDACEW